MSEKVITLIDMDCFYVQVEEREKPSLRGTPAAVVQYNKYQGGGIIAVNYEARAKGVTRQMRGQEAREKCPGITLVTVPEHRDKADLTKYRNASKEVMQVLRRFGGVVERASIDEAYIDLTAVVESRMGSIVDKSELAVVNQLGNTHVVGEVGEREEGVTSWLREIKAEEAESELRLAIGAAIVEEVRAAVYLETQFRCSAGIASCKTLAKLCCGLNKPNKQTVLPIAALSHLYSSLPVTKVRGLGGKLGDQVVTQLNCVTMQDLSTIPLKDLVREFEEKTGSWLFHLARGKDNEVVVERELPKSIGASKNFRGPDILDTRGKVKTRLRALAEEVVERLETDREEHGRVARHITVGGTLDEVGHASRSAPLHSYDLDRLFKDALALISKLNTAPGESEEWTPKLINISISAAKFEDVSTASTKSISTFFKKKEINSENEDLSVKNTCPEVTKTSPEPVKKSFFEKKELNTRSEASLDNAFNTSKEPSAELEEANNVDIKELIPSLDNYDPSLLQLLPISLREKAKDWVKSLQSQQKKGQGIAKFFGASQQVQGFSDNVKNNESSSDCKPTNDIDSDLVSCEKCAKLVSPFELPEHLDYHFALDIQRTERPVTAGTTSIERTAEKRKRDSPADSGDKKRKSDISSFFSRSK